MKLHRFAGFLVASILGLSAGALLLAGCSGGKVETDSAQETAVAAEASMVFYAMPG